MRAAKDRDASVVHVTVTDVTVAPVRIVASALNATMPAPKPLQTMPQRRWQTSLHNRHQSLWQLRLKLPPLRHPRAL